MLGFQDGGKLLGGGGFIIECMGLLVRNFDKNSSEVPSLVKHFNSFYLLLFYKLHLIPYNMAPGHIQEDAKSKP